MVSWVGEERSHRDLVGIYFYDRYVTKIVGFVIVLRIMGIVSETVALC